MTLSIRTSTDKEMYVKVPTSSCGRRENNCGAMTHIGARFPRVTITELNAEREIPAVIQGVVKEKEW